MKKLSTLMFIIILLLVVVGTALGAEENKFAVVSFMIHPYSGPTEVAMKDFMEDTGIKCEFNAPTKADQNEQNNIIEGMVTRGFNGFALFPSNAAAANGTITELVEMGIPVVTWGGPPKKPTDASLCIATDVKAAAKAATEKLVEEIDEEGNVVQLLGEISDPNTVLRRDGVREVVDKYPDVKLIQEVANIDTYEAAGEKIDNLLGARADEIDGMVATAYVPTVVASKALTDLGTKRIKFVGIDDDSKTLEAIRDGYITGTMVQSPYAQGYLSLTALKLLKEGYKVKEDVWFIDSGVVYVDKSNADNYSEEVKEKANEMLDTFAEKYFTK